MATKTDHSEQIKWLREKTETIGSVVKEVTEEVPITAEMILVVSAPALAELETLASMIDPETGFIDGTEYTVDDLFRLKADYNRGREAMHGRAY
jgi:hypothetical protein